jgi:hypothetical protein
MSEIAQILSAIEQGDRQAAERLLPLVYHELRRLAQEKPGQTVQATDLDHEAKLRDAKIDLQVPWLGGFEVDDHLR